MDNELIADFMDGLSNLRRYLCSNSGGSGCMCHYCTGVRSHGELLLSIVDRHLPPDEEGSTEQACGENTVEDTDSPWYLLYGGTSEDGIGQGEYEGRTRSRGKALEHYWKIKRDTYSVGRVVIYTKTEEKLVCCESDITGEQPG